MQNRLDKGDISSDEFKAEEKILNAQKKDIFDEIEELKGKYAEEIKRETYIKEGAAEDAEYSFYETESQGLEKLGEFNGLDRAAIGDLTANLVTPDEYSVGYLINKTIRKEQPDRAFEILHGTKDIQSVINFDELKNAIESELNAKTLFYAKINLDLSPEKK